MIKEGNPLPKPQGGRGLEGAMYGNKEGKDQG